MDKASALRKEETFREMTLR